VTSQSSNGTAIDDPDIALHRELDRLLDVWDDEPQYEKWRKGPRWM